MIEHVYRRAEASPVVSRVIVATDDLRIATTRHRLRRQRPADARRPSDRHRSARRGRRDARLRRRRQRAGRRAAARPAGDRRAGRAVRRSVDLDDDALPAHRQSAGAGEPEHRQGRARPRRLRPVFLAGADSARAGSARRLAAAVQAHRPVRLPAAARCWCSPRSSRRRSSAPKRSNSCGRSSTASGSRRSKPPYDSIGVDTPEDLEQVRRLLTTTSRN